MIIKIVKDVKIVETVKINNPNENDSQTMTIFVNNIFFQTTCIEKVSNKNGCRKILYNQSVTKKVELKTKKSRKNCFKVFSKEGGRNDEYRRSKIKSKR